MLKSLRASFCGLFFILILFQQVGAQGWKATGGPGAASVPALAVKGAYLFAGISSSGNADVAGVYRSSDEGVSWKWMSGPGSGFVSPSYPRAPSVAALLAKGSTLWAATNYGIFKSADDGVSWTVCNSGLSGGLNVTGIAALANGNIVASTWGGGIYISTDQGTSWNSSNNGFSGSTQNINCLNFSNNALWAGLAQGQGGLFKSTDGGQNWVSVPDSTGNSIENLAAIASGANGKMIAVADYGGNYDGGAFISLDGGTSWKHRSGHRAPDTTGLPFPINVRSCAVTDSGHFLVGTANGLYISRDSAKTWKHQANTGLNSTFILTIVQVNPQGKTYLGTLFAGSGTSNGNTLGGGVAMRSSFASTWQPRNFGLPSNAPVSMLRVVHNRLFAGMTLNVGGLNGLFGSDDNGHTWQQRSTGLGYAIGGNDFTAQGHDMYIAHYGGGVYKSSDTGKTWVPKNANLPSLTAYSIVARHDTVFLGTLGNFFRSTNGGTNWNSASAGMPTSPYVYSLTNAGGTLIAGMESVGILRTNNGGNLWTATSVTQGRISSVFALNDHIVLAGSNNQGEVLRSTDKGATWTQVAPGGPQSIYGFDTAHNGYVFAFAGAGIFFSADKGLTWHLANRGISSDTGEHQPAGVGALAVWGDTVYTAPYYLGSGVGVYRRPLSEFAAMITANKPTIAGTERSLKLYPNPIQAGQACRLDVETSISGGGTLILADALGRTVCRPALVLRPGVNTISVPTKGLPAGLYQVRLLQDGQPAQHTALVLQH